MKQPRLVKGYLIDPESKTITEVQHDASNYKEIYDLIGCHPSPFTVVYIDDRNCIFVDDEGLLKDPRYFFNWKGYQQPLAGKGLVLGSDAEGETQSASISLQEVIRNVTFSEHKMLGFVQSEGTTKMFDEDAWFIQNTPVFGPPEEES